MTDPIKWSDMTPEQKGALLLAHHEGKVIERYRYGGWGVVQEPHWFDGLAYRVKPEPVVEVVKFAYDLHLFTYNMINGEPDCDSIKMEKIND